MKSFDGKRKNFSNVNCVFGNVLEYDIFRIGGLRFACMFLRFDLHFCVGLTDFEVFIFFYVRKIL